MREAKEGRGVDRHLFGLRMLYEEHQAELGSLLILHITKKIQETHRACLAIQRMHAAVTGRYPLVTVDVLLSVCLDLDQ
jgi:hypothetical protein